MCKRSKLLFETNSFGTFYCGTAARFDYKEISTDLEVLIRVNLLEGKGPIRTLFSTSDLGYSCNGSRVPLLSVRVIFLKSVNFPIRLFCV